MTKIIIKRAEYSEYEFVSIHHLKVNSLSTGFPYLLVVIHNYEGNSPSICINGHKVDSDTEEYKTILFELTMLGYI